MDKLNDTFPILYFKGQPYTPRIRENRFGHDVEFCGEPDRPRSPNRNWSPRHLIITYESAAEKDQRLQKLCLEEFGFTLPSPLPQYCHRCSE